MYKILQYSLPIYLLLFFSSIAYSQMYNSQIEAEINIQQYGNTYNITGLAVNKTVSNQSLHYTLSVIKNQDDNSNTSKNDQKGRFVLEIGEKKNLSTTSINVSENQRVIVLLLIYDDKDTPLGMDRKVINPTEEDLALQKNDSIERERAVNPSPDVSTKPVDGIMIGGIVTEDTKTKPGRDFYKMFDQNYRLNNINGSEIVTIKEVLSLNNNTKIEVLVANEKVLEFFVRPQTEYLKQMADIAVRRVYWFLQQYKERKHTQKYY
ncbi:curli production assembly/transport protein CsgE [Aequorivita xiaoshiensis]|uniref:Curli production assembly/transport component CsgE n=1 Tax=Aequorivita xiaoshiensis TaxID=2874476 RepID=A0A9X1R2U5_9FLAO|nr:curli production assembly/transport protein CsgE [Aequorivita xiaoshiensis]MCG2430862.1 curli production assembly/transport protein CsgE [Aequorivita xiaoshiensis]